MRLTRQSFFLLILAVLVAAFWLIMELTKDDPVLGAGVIREVLRNLSICLTALLGAVLIGRLILLAMLAANRETELTGFQQVLIYGLMVFVVSLGILSYFGFDLRTI